jgi:hypothetical protein
MDRFARVIITISGGLYAFSLLLDGKFKAAAMFVYRKLRGCKCGKV